ncbi:MAG: transcriptional repressor [Lawsonibacter sp.]|nr:transcriptional repressor [Lawsonibacter sp.]
MKEYNTEQRVVLMTFFQENRGEQFSIDEIVARLPRQARISRSAVYRNVDRMVQEGLLRKARLEESRKALYQWMDCRHCERIHLRCEKCGRIFHMKSETDEETLKSVLQNSGFQLDKQASTLPVICKNCVG